MQRIPLILTRPAGSNAEFMRQLPQAVVAQVQGIECPLIGIEPLEVRVDMPAQAAALFTSSNGVRFAPPGQGRVAYCVGVRTTKRASEAGWQAVCAGQTAKELVRFMDKNRPGSPLVHLSGVHVRGDVVQSLENIGLSARRVQLYDQLLLPLSGAAYSVLGRQIPVIVPLFSPRAAAHFAAEAPVNPCLKIVALSPAVAQSAQQTNGFEVTTAPFPTTEALVGCIENIVRIVSLG